MEPDNELIAFMLQPMINEANTEHQRFLEYEDRDHPSNELARTIDNLVRKLEDAYHEDIE